MPCKRFDYFDILHQLHRLVHYKYKMNWIVHLAMQYSERFDWKKLMNSNASEYTELFPLQRRGVASNAKRTWLL